MPSKTDEAIERLMLKVEKIEGAADSAIAWITGAAQMVRDNRDDPPALDAIADRMDAKATAIGDAIAANPTE